MKTTNLYGKKTSLVVALIVALTISLFLSLGAGFTAQRAHADGATVGEMGMNLTLNDSVAANFHVYDVENNESGLYMQFTFLGETTRSATQTENGELVFTYYGVTPQYFNETITAELFEVGTGEDGADRSIKSTQTTVKANLTALLDSANGTFASGYQYLAMRQLAVDMLNYGAAAQTYKEIAGDKVNADLEDRESSLATTVETVTGGTSTHTSYTSESEGADTAVVWQGAGVRFDTKLGLYFLFAAKDEENLAVTVNGNKAKATLYETKENFNVYRIYYDGFTAVNMNSVVNVSVNKGGVGSATASYSVAAYIEAKQEDQALSALVKATYAYGQTATAYDTLGSLSAEDMEGATVTRPNEGQTGSVTIKGVTVKLPKLNEIDYTFDANGSWTNSAVAAIDCGTEYLKVGNVYYYSDDARYDDTENVFDMGDMTFEDSVTMTAAGATVSFDSVTFSQKGSDNAKGALTVNGGTIEIGSLSAAKLIVAGGAVTIDTNVTLTGKDATWGSTYGNLSLPGGSLTVNGTLTVEGDYYTDRLQINGGELTTQGIVSHAFNQITGETIVNGQMIVYGDKDAKNFRLKGGSLEVNATAGQAAIVAAGITVGTETTKATLIVNANGADAFTLAGSGLYIADYNFVNATVTVTNTATKGGTAFCFNETPNSGDGNSYDSNIHVQQNASIEVTNFNYSIGGWNNCFNYVEIFGSFNLNDNPTHHNTIYLKNNAYINPTGSVESTYTVLKATGKINNVEAEDNLTIQGNVTMDRLKFTNAAETSNRTLTVTNGEVVLAQLSQAQKLAVSGGTLTVNSDVVLQGSDGTNTWSNVLISGGTTTINGQLQIWGDKSEGWNDRLKMTGGTLNVFCTESGKTALQTAHMDIANGAQLNVRSNNADGINFNGIGQTSATYNIAGTVTVENLYGSNSSGTAVCFSVEGSSAIVNMNNGGKLILWNYGTVFGAWNGSSITINHNSGSMMIASCRKDTRGEWGSSIPNHVWNGGEYNPTTEDATLNDRPSELPQLPA